MENKKNYTIVIRITDEQQEMLKILSEKTGMDKSSVLRACLDIISKRYKNAND